MGRRMSLLKVAPEVRVVQNPRNSTMRTYGTRFRTVLFLPIKCSSGAWKSLAAQIDFQFKMQNSNSSGSRADVLVDF